MVTIAQSSLVAIMAICVALGGILGVTGMTLVSSIRTLIFLSRKR